MKHDLAVAGGGPVGLATAIAAAQEGLRVIVLERRPLPVDKACGEGILPHGLRALAALGVRDFDPAECSPIAGIRYVQEDGSIAEARLPEPGCAVRRPALSESLVDRARDLGVTIVDRCAVRGFHRQADAIVLDTDAGVVVAQMLAIADGLHSRLRAAAGLELPPPRGPRRFGLRQHFLAPAWTDFVEVHFAGGAEAYVTPCGPGRVGVALLWQGGAPPALDRFAHLPLTGAVAASSPRGAGPMAQRSRARIADRLVLIGDAAGYVDAITGEGLSLGFACARALGRILPHAIELGGAEAALAPYEQAFQREFRRYALLARSLVALAARPRARRRVVHALARHPAAFARILRWATV